MDSMVDKNVLQDLIGQIKDHEEAFLKVIHERIGIVIRTHQTSDLMRTVAEACIKFKMSPFDYLVTIQSCPTHTDFLEHLVLGLTVGETYFFRDKRQMDLLEKNLIPRIISAKRKQNNLSLRIWSAACSSGEEIYTLAMMLCEMIPDIRDWRIDLLGTDINKKVLADCLAGRYSEWSMRAISDYHKQKYLVKEKNVYLLSDQIKRMAKFSYLNLHDNLYPAILNGTSAQDLILCRNVMIYFDSKQVELIMKKLNQSLVPGGFLLLGASDPVNIADTSFKFFHEDAAIYFEKV